MATTYIGSVAIYGVDGLVDVAGVIVSTNFKNTDASVTDNFGVYDHKDGEANTIGWSATGREQAATFTIIPTSVTVAGDAGGGGEADPATELDAVRAMLVFPLPLATVVVTGFGAGAPDAIAPFRGSWAYVGGSVTFNADGAITMVLNCERYNDDPATQTVF